MSVLNGGLSGGGSGGGGGGGGGGTALPAAFADYKLTATEGQTAFTATGMFLGNGYLVFVNGTLLDAGFYSGATDTVTLTNAVTEGTEVRIVTPSGDTGVGGGGIVNHNDALLRDAPEAHPISSITGLQTVLDTAQTTANTGVTNAATAQSAANAAQGTADTAITNAATAQLAAVNAQTTANTAQGTADTALTRTQIDVAKALGTTSPVFQMGLSPLDAALPEDVMSVLASSHPSRHFEPYRVSAATVQQSSGYAISGRNGGYAFSSTSSAGSGGFCYAQETTVTSRWYIYQALAYPTGILAVANAIYADFCVDDVGLTGTTLAVGMRFGLKFGSTATEIQDYVGVGVQEVAGKWHWTASVKRAENPVSTHHTLANDLTAIGTDLSNNPQTPRCLRIVWVRRPNNTQSVLLFIRKKKDSYGTGAAGMFDFWEPCVLCGQVDDESPSIFPADTTSLGIWISYRVASSAGSLLLAPGFGVGTIGALAR